MLRVARSRPARSITRTTGTRYGASGLAGLVYIKSNDPMPDPSADLALGYGSYGRRTGSLVLNYPLVIEPR